MKRVLTLFAAALCISASAAANKVSTRFIVILTEVSGLELLDDER